MLLNVAKFPVAYLSRIASVMTGTYVPLTHYLHTFYFADEYFG